jgi:hypothetical protein
MSEISPPAPAFERGSAPALARVGAFVAALILLLVGGLLSFGTVLLAPIGMWAYRVFLRRRRRPFTRFASWSAATATVLVLLVLSVGAFVAMMPAGSVKQILATSDSASAAAASQKTAPPAWLEKIAPGTAAVSARQSPPTSPLLVKIFLIWGGGLGLILMAGFYGSLGWAGGMLGGLALRGHWPGQRDATTPSVV